MSESKMGAAMQIILIVAAAAVAFFVYQRYVKGKAFSKAFSNPIDVHDPSTGKSLGTRPEEAFLSPITKKALAGQARAYYAGATY